MRGREDERWRREEEEERIRFGEEERRGVGVKRREGEECKYRRGGEERRRGGDCNIYWLETINQMQLAMISSHNAFDNTLWTAISGNNNMLLTPKSLDPLALKQIVENMTLFQDLIYREDHNLLYSTATLNLVEISNNLTTAHFVMTFPTIHKNSRMFTLYKTHQVGTYTPPAQCSYRSLPDHVALDGEIFLSFRVDDCVRHGNIYLCNPEAVDENKSCIQLRNLTCGYKFSRCTDNISEIRYITSLAGLLIRNNVKESTFVRYNNKSIVPVDLTLHHTAFVNWTNVSEVHIHNVRIVSPNLVGKPISIVNYINGLEYIPFDYFNNESISNTFNAISNKFNKSIDQLLIPVFDGWHSSDMTYIFRKYTHVLFAAVVAIIFWLLAISCYLCRNTPCVTTCCQCGACFVNFLIPCTRTYRDHLPLPEIELENFHNENNDKNNSKNSPVDDKINDEHNQDQIITRSI